MQEFFSLSDRIAKTYAGFNSSGEGCLSCGAFAVGVEVRGRAQPRPTPASTPRVRGDRWGGHNVP